MYRIALSSSLLVGLLVVSPARAEKPQVVDLWPGKTPGDVGIKGQETSRIHQSPLVGPTKLITNVTRPTLTIYRPATDKNTGTAMLICPGGGYWDLYWDLEGEEVAAWLNSLGMTGIILKYRCPRRPGDVQGEPPLGPQLDAQRAVSLVRSRAEEWGIDPKRIGMVGFSAGGHLALATATNFRSGSTSRSTPSTRSVAGRISPSCAIRAISRPRTRMSSGRIFASRPTRRRSSWSMPPTTRRATAAPTRRTAWSCTWP